MTLQTSVQIAMARSEHCVLESLEFALFRKNLNCEGTHNDGGYPMAGVTEHRVDRLSVTLYPPGTNRIFIRGDGWINPLQVIETAGCRIDRPVCLHRNRHTGSYMVFQL